ncbi:MAG: protease complex subunit PrcB family protein [Verrucomicrobiota bacterium]
MKFILAGIVLLSGIWVSLAEGSDAVKGEKMRVLAKGGFSTFQEPTTMVITNAVQWEETWKKSSKRVPAPELPEVDFEKESVIFVTLGRKNSGGYASHVESVTEKDGKTVVQVVTKSPPKGSMTLQALTAPFEFVAVPKIKGEVAFQSTEEKKKQE